MIAVGIEEMAGRTEFWLQRLEASPGWKAQTTHESEMALFYECMQWCARILLETADIVRDGAFSPIDPLADRRVPSVHWLDLLL